MKKMLFSLFFAVYTVVFLSCGNCLAEGQQARAEVQETAIQEQEEAQFLKGIELLTGYGWSRINAKNDYELKRDYDMFPFILDLSFNLKDLTKKIGINPPGALEFQLEPYVAYVSSPDANAEIGTSFMFKLGILPEDWTIQPYIKVGAGMVYMTQHTREQSTQFNFIESGCAGVHYFFTKNTALTVEGRMRHLSNAGIKQPNHGINTYQVLAGIAYKY